jgi:hypothetical protein
VHAAEPITGNDGPPVRCHSAAQHGRIGGECSDD